MDMLTPFDQARIRRPSCWPVAACIFLFGAGALPAGNHYVRPPGTCTNTQLQAPYGSWGDAATSIQWAVDAAMAALPATVWVTNGSYCVTNQITVTNAITLKSVTGWTNTVVYADWPACTTRVFYLSNNVAIDGFTVSNGHEFSALGGGGMYAVSNCIVRNCRIIYNVSSNAVGYTGAKGGGVFADRGSIVSNCLVLNNRVIGAWQYGAGIALGVNSAALNCQAISNSGSGGGYGGGIYGDVSTVVSNCFCAFNSHQQGAGINFKGLVTDCVVVSNSASWGAVFSQYSSEALIRRTDIINNSAAGFCSTYGVVDKPPLVSNCYIAGNSGAGVHSQSGTSPIKVFNSVITGNKGGGVYLTDGGAAIIDSCRISNNQVSAGRYGAGIFATRGQIRNCIINNNTNVSPGYFGGGVCMTNAAGNTNMPCGLVNCVIADNYSTNEGGGLALFGESNLVANCIIINNRSSSNIYPDVYNTLSNSNNFWNCCANVAAAPLPPTQGNITNDPMLASGYRPHRNSPCVNAGLNQAWMTNAVDFDCQKRVFYRVVDIGPFERVYSGTVFCFQ